MRLETDLHHLPLAYRCAVETLGSNGERTRVRLDSLCDHFENVNAMQQLQPDERAFFRDSAAGICSRRFYDWQA